MSCKKNKIHYDRNGIKICDKPSERMFGFIFNDTLVEKMVRETEEKFFQEDSKVTNGRKTR
jgi:hypothetical protein